MTTHVDSFIDDLVRPIADWPEPGVTFRDITPLLGDAAALASTIDSLTQLAEQVGPVDAVLGIEARGFILGPAIALRLGVGFVPVRKVGELPAETHAVSYDLEYGSATLEMHVGALVPGARVLVVDDVLATGGDDAGCGRSGPPGRRRRRRQPRPDRDRRAGRWRTPCPGRLCRPPYLLKTSTMNQHQVRIVALVLVSVLVLGAAATLIGELALTLLSTERWHLWPTMDDTGRSPRG
ncbi:adenine phosphoribosyltransferase [Aeromicrobium sp. UC242_57]|uniref:adenine phosphoribosyltransferase n=1 Tax=Aeromicrobium sp. UC242_57 TaxID=3374624 RepID=UPI0037A65DDC